MPFIGGRKKLFGKIKKGNVELSEMGQIAKKYWLEIPDCFNHVKLDKFVFMPDHMHGILRLVEPQLSHVSKRAINRALTNVDRVGGGITGNNNPMLSKNSISRIIRWFKGRSSYEIHKRHPWFDWQSRFYDEIINDKKQLIKTRMYIKTNPKNWLEDA